MSKKSIMKGVAALFMVCATTSSQAGLFSDDQAGIVAGELSSIAKILSQRPETAIDFTKTSGEYCFNVQMGQGGHMTHYATHPESTKEDVIDFVNAAKLEEMGADFSKLPRFPGKLGSMTPKQWYYLPKGVFEPHHGKTFPFPVLIRAVDIN
ncbi:MAG: hypothetical protein D6698_00800 [Gammaproteobacteria bacterium]|nr:MAG: hypothetical protein D6698_00800 [Gammaproteobacteria bacterium]